MKERFRCFLMGCMFFVALGQLHAEGGGNVLDDCKNPYVEIENVVLIPSPVAGESLVEITFDKDVHLDEECALHSIGALNIPLDPTVELTMARLVNLGGNDSLDLVVGRGAEILLYPNLASQESGRLRIEGEPILLATRKTWDYRLPESPPNVNIEGFAEEDDLYSHYGTSITFANIDGDEYLDLICGGARHGHISYFKGVGNEQGWPRFSTNQQLLLKESSGSDSVDFIGIAMQDGTGDSSKDDQLAIPIFLDFNGDEHLDMLVGDSRVGTLNNGVVNNPMGNIHIFIGKGLASSYYPGEGDIPLFSDSFLLTAGSAQEPILFENRNKGMTTPSLFDVDKDGDDDLVICSTSGYLRYYPNVGTNELGELRFGSAEFFPQGTLFEGGKIAGSGMDINGDGEIDFISTSKSTVPPFRREIRLHISSPEGEVDRTGEVIGVRNGMRFRGASGGESWAPGDLNRDGHQDLLLGMEDGRLGIFYSTDTSNTFDAQYSSMMYVRNIDGSEFSVDQLDSGIYPHSSDSFHRIYPALVDLDGELDGDDRLFPEVIVLGLYDALVVLPIGYIDNAGCVRVDSLGAYSITPSEYSPTDEKHGMQVQFGSFSVEGGSVEGVPTGAVIIRRNLYNVSPIPVEYRDVSVDDGNLLLSLTSSLIDPGTIDPDDTFYRDFPSPAYPPGTVHKRIRYTNPTFMDVDDDGHLDLVMTDSPGVFWMRNTSESEIPNFISPPILLNAVGTSGDPIVTPEITPDVAIRAISEREGKYLLMGGESTPSRLYTMIKPEEGDPYLELASDTEEAIIKHLLPTEVSQEEPQKITARFPVLLEPGDAIAINRLFVDGLDSGPDQLCAFACVPIVGFDSDRDGLSDEWELAHGLDPEDADEDGNEQVDSLDDLDGDGETNQEESLAGTDPYNSVLSATALPTVSGLEDGRIAYFALDYSETDGETMVSTPNGETGPNTGSAFFIGDILPDGDSIRVNGMSIDEIAQNPRNGQIPKAILFDSNTGPTALGADFDEDADFSVGFWFLSSNVSNKRIPILTIGSVDSGELWEVYFSQSGSLVEVGSRRYIDGESEKVLLFKTFAADVILNDDEWHHFGLTMDLQSEDLVVYVDGEILYSDKVSFHETISSFQGFDQHRMYFGAEIKAFNGVNSNNQFGSPGGDSSRQRQLDGAIDEIQIFNRVLSEGEVLALSSPFSFSEDVDRDGLPDEWELANLSKLNFGPNDNPDWDYEDSTPDRLGSDPFVNFEEYRAEADPNSYYNDQQGGGQGVLSLTDESNPLSVIPRDGRFHGPFSVEFTPLFPGLDLGFPIQLEVVGGPEGTVWSTSPEGINPMPLGVIRADMLESDGKTQSFQFYLSTPAQ